MIKHVNLFAIGTAIIALSGCGSSGAAIPAAELRAIEQGEQYELFSLDPDMRKRVDEASPDGFHRWLILGRTTISDATIRKKLNDALAEGARNSGNMAAACFNPRHAIRVTLGNEVFDFIICFECRQVEIFKGDSKVSQFLTSDSPQSVFDSVLKQAGVPLPPADD